jgi:starch synthase
MEHKVQFVLLGRGDFYYEQAFLSAQNRYPGRMSVNIRFSDALAAQIYAGADIFLMPSQAEPCGLSQMIAMRYGTVPVVRETGGLRDTVPPYDYASGQGGGFTFFNYNADDMLDAVNRALSLYCDRDAWKALVTNDMSRDFGWGRSAREYLALYDALSRG